LKRTAEDAFPEELAEMGESLKPENGDPQAPKTEAINPDIENEGNIKPVAKGLSEDPTVAEGDALKRAGELASDIPLPA